MIRPLRRIQRAVFLALGIALPVLFIAGLASRHVPLSVVGKTEGKLVPASGGTEFVLNRSSSKFRVRLLENKKGGLNREFRAIPSSGFVAPDVFVYWSQIQPAASLGPDAKLLGKLGSGELYRIPSGSGGYFVLYSVAQNEVLGSVLIGAGT